MEVGPEQPLWKSSLEAMLETVVTPLRRGRSSTLMVQVSDPQHVRVVIDFLQAAELKELPVGFMTSLPDDAFNELLREKDFVVRIPKDATGLTTVTNLGLFYAVVNGSIHSEENIACLPQASAAVRWDDFRMRKPESVFPWLSRIDLARLKENVPLSIFQRIIEIALDFATHPKEGEKIGTMFVIGRQADMADHIAQDIDGFNAMAGKPPGIINIHTPNLRSFLKSISGADGAYVVLTDTEIQFEYLVPDDPGEPGRLTTFKKLQHRAVVNPGTVISSGTFVRASAEGGARAAIPGKGSRHLSAQEFTRSLKDKSVVAVVVSKDTSVVTVYLGGEVLLEINKSTDN